MSWSAISSCLLSASWTLVLDELVNMSSPVCKDFTESTTKRRLLPSLDGVYSGTLLWNFRPRRRTRCWISRRRNFVQQSANCRRAVKSVIFHNTFGAARRSSATLHGWSWDAHAYERTSLCVAERSRAILESYFGKWGFIRLNDRVLNCMPYNMQLADHLPVTTRFILLKCHWLAFTVTVCSPWATLLTTTGLYIALGTSRTSVTRSCFIIDI